VDACCDKVSVVRHFIVFDGYKSCEDISLTEKEIIKVRSVVIVIALLAFCWQVQAASNPTPMSIKGKGNKPKTIKVAVLCFDPYCPGHGNKRTHEVFGWYDPQKSIETYINDLKTASGGWARYKVVSFYYINYYPYFEDGFRYDPDEYVEAWKNRPATTMHKGMTDYKKLLCDKSYDYNNPKSIAERVKSGEIDEVFSFSSPGSMDGGGEAAMAGPNPFFVNGGVFKIPETGRNVVLMGFNYEREVGCMLEDFCHRTEAIMSRVYKAKDMFYPTLPADNNWEKFRMIDKVDAGNAACGFCHYAPNSAHDYDWGNTTKVYSTCDDWLYNWPNLKGAVTKRLVDNTEWGGGDTRLHHIWWLSHIPRTAGVNPDGKQNNWWKYICDFNSYPESR